MRASIRFEMTARIGYAMLLVLLAGGMVWSRLHLGREHTGSRVAPGRGGATRAASWQTAVSVAAAKPVIARAIRAGTPAAQGPGTMRTTLRIITLALLTTFAAAQATGCDKKDKAGAEKERDKVPETREGQSFMLGQELAIAAVGQANGAKPQTVAGSFRNAATMTEILLDMKLEPLPTPTGDFAEDAAAILHYLLDGPGREIGQKVHADFGEESGASYELALKLTMLSLLYIDDPADPMPDTLAEVLGKLGAKAKLPPEVLEPLIGKLKARAPSSEVMDLAIGLHKTIPAAIEKVYGKPS